MARRSRPKPVDKPLTPTELEVMNIIWRHGDCSVHQIVELLASERSLAYTSVSSVVRILEKKAFLQSGTMGRTHIYTAAITREGYQHKTLDKLVNTLFDGKPSLLLSRLLGLKQSDAGEVQEMRTLVRGRR
jgi:predicted transcriptional regulator